MSDTKSKESLLVGLLATAVLVEIDRMRGMGEPYRLATARKCGQYIAEHGDNVLFRSGDRKHTTAKAFAVLARGLAVLAFQPGGVTFAGHLWCATHPRQQRPDGRICPECLAEEDQRTGAAS